MFTSRNTTRQLAQSGVDTALLSFGSTEQFGPYLPMHIDCLLAEMYACKYGQALDAYVLPVVPFNTSEEHAHFKGTITLSPQLLSMMTEEIVACLMAQGFKKFVLVNGHGGANWVGSCIKYLNYKYTNMLLVYAHFNTEEAWKRASNDAAFPFNNDIHGGLLGLCTALYLCPDAVDYVAIQSFGSIPPHHHNQFMDYMGWERLTPDGSWGNFERNIAQSKEELGERGKPFWETFVQYQSEALRLHLEEAYQLKFDNGE